MNINKTNIWHKFLVGLPAERKKMKIDNDILLLNNINEHEKLILLVDEINSDKSFGITRSFVKVKRNIQFLGFEIRHEFEKELLRTSKSLICIWELGRFLTLVHVSSNREHGMMLFFENSRKAEPLLHEAADILGRVFPDEVVDNFKKHYEEMRGSFSEEDNVVELSVDAYDLN